MIMKREKLNTLSERDLLLGLIVSEPGCSVEKGC